jgi:hypothetical protein
METFPEIVELRKHSAALSNLYKLYERGETSIADIDAEDEVK